MQKETKVELLRYQLLNQRFDYDMEVYSLFTWGKMTDVIDRINDKTFSYKVDLEKNEISSTQFLDYMNLFVKYMKSYFYQMNCFNVALNEIIKGAEIELNTLFDYKYYDIHNCLGLKTDNQLKERIFKLIISNFIQNAKYVPLIKEILKENGLKLKPVQEYKLEECNKIMNILSEIAFCQRGRGIVLNLFENIDLHLAEYLKLKNTSKSKKYTIEDFKNRYIDSYIKDYNLLIKSYNARKKYLKYFV